MLGLACVGLGAVGVFVPLLPTTCFLIAAAACFAKSAPHWRRRILTHPRFGRPVRDFVEHRALSGQAKCLSLAGILANFLLVLLVTDLGAAPLLAVAGILLAVSFYIVRRPTPPAPAY